MIMGTKVHELRRSDMFIDSVIQTHWQAPSERHVRLDRCAQPDEVLTFRTYGAQDMGDGSVL